MARLTTNIERDIQEILRTLRAWRDTSISFVLFYLVVASYIGMIILGALTFLCQALIVNLCEASRDKPPT